MSRSIKRFSLMFATFVLMATQVAVADFFTYALDDGTAEQVRGFGPAPGASFFSANEFTANPAGDLITSISVAFGSPTQQYGAIGGTPVTFILFRDANGLATPTNPILLASVSTTIRSPDSNTFVTASINPTLVAGNFFVGVFASNLPQGGTFPLGFDTSSPQDRS